MCPSEISYIAQGDQGGVTSHLHQHQIKLDSTLVSPVSVVPMTDENREFIDRGVLLTMVHPQQKMVENH